MRILIAHNYYQQPGGEDVVFEAEARLLEAHGHDVTRYVMRNDQINEIGRVKVAAATLWNRTAHREVREVVRSRQIEVAHFHNTFPLISPAAHSAAPRSRSTGTSQYGVKIQPEIGNCAIASGHWLTNASPTGYGWVSAVF